MSKENWSEHGPKGYEDTWAFVNWENAQILRKGAPPVNRVVYSPNFKIGKGTEIFNVHDINGKIIEIDGKTDFDRMEVYIIYRDKKW